MRSDDLADTADSRRMDGARTLLAELPLCRRYRAERSCRGAPIDQVILLSETLIGIVVAGWLLRNTWRPCRKLAGQAAIPLLRLGASLFLLIFAAGLLGGIIGYVRLVSLLVSGALEAAVTAPLLYAFVRVTSGLVAFTLRVWPLSALRMVQRHRDLLEKRAYHLLLLVRSSAGSCVTWTTLVY